MNKIQKAVLMATFLASIGTQANAESFVGGSLGLASYPDFVTSDTATVANAVSAANGGALILATGTQDKSGTGLKIFGGSWVNDNLGFEIGYVDLGSSKETITTIPVVTTWNVASKASAFYGEVLAGIKTNDQTRLFAKLGIYQASGKTDYSVTGPGGTAALSLSASNSGGVFGIGSSYQISPTVGMRVEYEYFGSVKINNTTSANIGLLSLGLAYTF